MKSDFSKNWSSSKQPRKQRKYQYNLPLHKAGNLLGVHLSAELREKHKKRSMRVRKGDKVKVLTGQHKGKTGKVEEVSVKDSKVSIEGIQVSKKEGSKSFYRFHPSNLVIQELTSDKKRFKGEKE